MRQARRRGVVRAPAHATPGAHSSGRRPPSRRATGRPSAVAAAISIRAPADRIRVMRPIPAVGSAPRGRPSTVRRPVPHEERINDGPQATPATAPSAIAGATEARCVKRRAAAGCAAARRAAGTVRAAHRKVGESRPPRRQRGAQPRRRQTLVAGGELGAVDGGPPTVTWTMYSSASGSSWGSGAAASTTTSVAPGKMSSVGGSRRRTPGR